MEAPAAVLRWSLAQRVGFRFLFTYFVLFFLTGQEIAQFPFTTLLVEAYTERWHSIAVWVGRNFFQITRDIPIEGQGSGDTTFRWLLLPCYLALACVVTILWSLRDRKKANYERLHQWFRLMLRFSLAGAMIVYGISKVIPVQMPVPNPGTLLQRVGELSRMRMLWTFMGTSPTYETITGLAELLGGVLLLVPRTTLLGALISAANMAMVFVLNICYDVPVKIMSFHYLLMAVILLAPDLHRMAGLFLFNRTVEPARTPPPLFARKWLNRTPQILLFVFGLYAIATSFYQSIEWYRQVNPSTLPPYGVWSVEEMTIEGQSTDAGKWQWVTAGQRNGELRVELASGSRASYAFDLDAAKRRMTLWEVQRGPDRTVLRNAAGKPQRTSKREGEFSFLETEANTLVLDGVLDGHRTHAKLRKMPLVQKRFRWIIDPEDEF